MTNALRIIVLCVCAGLMAAAQTDGEWTANRIPGHTKVWTAERSSQEVARVAAAAAFAYSPTNPPPSGGGSVASVNGQTGVVTITAASVGALTNEADAAALAKLAAHTNRTDNPHGVTAAQIGAPSVAALYTLMATSNVDKVWEGTNVWWTFESNTVIRHCFSILSGSENYAFSGAGVSAADGNYYAAETALTYTNLNRYVLHFVEFIHGYELADDTMSALYRSYGTDVLGPYTETYPEYSPAPSVVYVPTVVITNTTTYYLQTNLVPPETWSYADQTNWMEDGNAGQLWVSDLAARAANVLLNGHLNATEPHAGKYALQTGGTMTNVTLAGTVNLTNAVSFVAGQLNGTNGVRFNVSGNPTNYWLLFY